jgi:hypothetical protein
MENKPQLLTTAEWLEIVKMPYVRETWGIDDKEAETSFRDSVYAAKFDYASDGPGFAGDLYVLLGGEAECPPVVIKRVNGNLEVAERANY